MIALRINKTFCGKPQIGLRIHKITCRFTPFVAIHVIVCESNSFGVIHRFLCQIPKCYVDPQKFLGIHESFCQSIKFYVDPQKFLSVHTLFEDILTIFRISTNFVDSNTFLRRSSPFSWISKKVCFFELDKSYQNIVYGN